MHMNEPQAPMHSKMKAEGTKEVDRQWEEADQLGREMGDLHRGLAGFLAVSLWACWQYHFHLSE